ncbi:MAG: 1,4-dihydroxy-2-naphthoate octaprenyltransferase [Deltaproteobacteria bacterium]|nr:1,4-dihydroxy-2-naphthoate octaprenyltransferase [Deltaproteobacteria bacterium]
MNPWILALRPKTLTAALVPILVATALVHASGIAVKWWVSVFALIASFFIQIATNLINDAIDFDKGADTDQRTGPKRVTQSGMISRRKVMVGAGVCLALAFAFGVPLVVEGGWPIAAIGVVSIALAYGYTGGPFPLAYMGLGDLFVILFFGVIGVMGTFFLHTGQWSELAAVAGLQVGFLATVLIAINNLRDSPEDVKVGKKTLAVRFGAKFSKIEIAVLCYAPFLMGMAYENRGWMWAAYAPLIAVPLVSRLVRGIWAADPGPVMNRFLAMAAALHLLFGLALAGGLWFGTKT